LETQHPTEEDDTGHKGPVERFGNKNSQDIVIYPESIQINK
jgi:hypothetical protein